MTNAKRHKHLHPPPHHHRRSSQQQQQQQQQRPATTTSKTKHRPESRQKPTSQEREQKKKKKQQQQQQQQAPRAIIPFAPLQRILLLGEGDLSFAASLVRHHRCRHVTATVREKDHTALLAKHPAADAHLAALLEPLPPVRAAAAAIGGGGGPDRVEEGSDEGQDVEEEDGVGEAEQDNTLDLHHDLHGRICSPKNPPLASSSSSSSSRILYDVDATRPPPSLLRPPHYDRVVFNFPHVGGLSTDTNRQVRHNQALLVAFFQRTALPALAPHGAVLVTLFEAEPYTLWNVRDLARHAGLAVERSFAFRPDAYPGYRHARTAGHTRHPAGWEAALRPARTYIFRRKEELARDDALASGRSRRKTKKRRRGDETSSSDDEDDDYGQEP